METSPLLTGDLLPFVRPGVKNNFKTPIDGIKAFVAAPEIECLRIAMVDSQTSSEQLVITGTTNEQILPGNPFVPTHNYSAEIVNNTTRDVAVSYASYLKIQTTAPAAGLIAGANHFSKQNIALIAKCSISVDVTLTGYGEYTAEVYHFTDHFIKVGDLYISEHIKSQFVETRFIIPEGESASTTFSAAVNSLQFSEGVTGTTIPNLFTIRVDGPTPDDVQARMNAFIFK